MNIEGIKERFSSDKHRMCFEELMRLERGRKLSQKKLRRFEDLIPDIIHQLNDLFNPALKNEYEEIFFKRLSHLNEMAFDRTLINKKVLKCITPKYYHAYKEFLANFLKLRPADITENARYYRIALKVIRLGLKLGVPPEPVSKGVNGTYFMRDLAGRRIGVFKPSDEEYLSENSASRIKKFRHLANTLPICETFIFLQGGNAHKSEEMASIISQKLKLYNVPITKVVALKSYQFYKKKEKHSKKRVKKIGSLQLYVSEAIDAGKALKIGRSWCLLPDGGRYLLKYTGRKGKIRQNLSQKDFIHMAVADFLIAQLDRHPGNWVIGEQIFLIDNGATMPHKHSDSRISRLNQYAWRILPQAGIPFGDYALKIVNLLESRVEDIIEKFKRKQLITEMGQEVTFRERVQVLIWHVRTKKTPRQLALVRSSQNFKEMLTSIESP